MLIVRVPAGRTPLSPPGGNAWAPTPFPLRRLSGPVKMSEDENHAPGGHCATKTDEYIDESYHRCKGAAARGKTVDPAGPALSRCTRPGAGARCRRLCQAPDAGAQPGALAPGPNPTDRTLRPATESGVRTVTRRARARRRVRFGRTRAIIDASCRRSPIASRTILRRAGFCMRSGRRCSCTPLSSS